MSERLGERTREGIGVSAPRIDGVPKAKGQFAYGSDLWADEMLWGHTLRSPHPSARIRSIQIAEAVASPGVHAILLADDVPGSRFYGLEFADQPVLAWEVVRYVGEPVALVAAEHPELARRAADRIVVDYEPLPAVTDMVEALDPGAPQVHPFGNVLSEVRVVHGDPDAEAEVWVEGYYETGMQDQAPLGPEAGLAVPAEDGGIDLFVPTQWLHVDRAQLAPCLNLPFEKVRLFLAGTGGAFGAREDVSIQIHASMLALYTGRPVKMSYGRAESFVGHVHRHPSRIWMRTGATRDGGLVNVRARILIDGGAYTSSSIAVISNASTFAPGPYEVPNALIEGTCVFTNNPPCGAMRGFGAVQVCFAHEGQMDRLAAALRMDPVQLRARNAAATGTVLPTGQVIGGAAPVREVIERCARIAMPRPQPSGRREAVDLPGGAAGNVGRGEGVRRGVGFAVGYKNHGYSTGFDDSSEARVTLSAGPDGPVAEVHTAAAEVGQGVHTILAQIARTVLGVERVILHTSDTLVGSAGSTSASRQTMVSGGAVKAACEAVLEELFERARRDAGLTASEVGVEVGFVTAGGERVAPVEEFLSEPIVCTRVWRHRSTSPLDERGQGDAHVGFLFGAQRAVVEVDEDLGLVRVLQLATAQDVGLAINPQSVIGQIEGGSAQGLGLALMEEIRLEDGRITNASFTDYLLPTTLDMPRVEVELVEEPEPDTPFGVKGVGEPSTVVAPAAIAAALRDALGIELNRIPVRPDDLIGLRRPPPTPPWPPFPEHPASEPSPARAGIHRTGVPT
jgi:xanthine dehydrogenase D subunit